MFAKLKLMNPFVKMALALILFVGSYFGLQSEYQSIGYMAMFASLMIMFEGFEFSLFTKILIALVVGVAISVSGIFNPDDLVAVKPVGSKIFMNCLTMALVPLVFSSILTGVTSLGDLKKLNKIGLRTITYYIATTAIAISIGLTYANVFNPGDDIPEEVKNKFEQTFKSSAETTVKSAEENKQSMFETLQSVFPSNILHSVSDLKPNMLQLIFFAVICGIALLQIERKYSEPVISFFAGITEMTVKIIMMVMRLAPYGVFALITSTIASTQSTDLLLTLIPFSAVVILGLVTHAIGTNFLALKFLAKRDPRWFFSRIKEVAITAFSTSSSGATMPLTLETVEKKMGVKNEVAGFVIPLGATINMDGTALFQGVSAIFLANIFPDVHLTFIDQLTIVGMAVLASVGTAAVPGVGIVILTMILVQVGIPAAGILFILPVNNLLDMCRTTVNVIGDMACSVYIDSTLEEEPRTESAVAV